MSNQQWETMDEKDFESMLENNLSEIPPEEIVSGVTPWKKAMNRILAGMALCSITLNALCLNYILPVTGIILLLLGFRALRGENRWFRTCFFITIVRAVYLFQMLILNTTILTSTIPTQSVATVLTVVDAVLLLAVFFCFWRGLQTVQQKVGLPAHAGGAAALMVWYAIVYALAAVQYSGWIVPIAMIIGYIYILRSIYRISGELDEAGYSIQATPSRISDGWIVAAIVTVLVAGGVCGYLFGGSYPMHWSEVPAAEHSKVETTKARLLELGFPETVLNDLRAEDIAACEDALQVVVDVTEVSVGDSGRQELQVTGIGVQLPGTRERWMLFHYFLWKEDPGFYGTEALQIWPAYQDMTGTWAPDGAVGGRILYDRGGTTFCAPYYALETKDYTADSLFWGVQTHSDIFASFSMPARGEHYRGYVAYPIAELQDGSVVSSWLNYTHQTSWLQYPAVTAVESRMNNTWSMGGVFKTMQSALQFFPDDENAEVIG